MKVEDLLKLSEAASKPWILTSNGEPYIANANDYPVLLSEGDSIDDLKFCAAASVALPELARRLMRLRELLPANTMYAFNEIADELRDLIHLELESPS